MGISTDALFFYGICWDEEDHEWPWATNPGKFGLELDGDDYADAKGKYVGDCAEHVLKKLRLLSHLTVDTHCMSSCPMGFVAITSTLTRAWRGYPQSVTVYLHTSPSADHEKHLRKFCEGVGYDFDALVKAERLGWWVCSDTDWCG